MKARCSLKYQRGASFLLLVSIIFAISAGIVLLEASQLARQRANDWQTIQLERVNTAADLVRAYYVHNAALWDASSATVARAPGKQLEATVLSLANVPGQWNLVAHVSDLIQGKTTSTSLEGLTAPQIEYREVYILAPVDNGPPETFDYTTGTLTLCPNGNCPLRANTRIDGAAIESELYSRSLKILNDLAISAQAYFNAKYLSYPDHDTSINWFRDPRQTDCTVAATDMPCVNGWLDTSNIQAATVLALLWQPDADPTNEAACIADSPLICPETDAWGNRLYISNGNDGSGNPFGTAYTPPFPTSNPNPYRMGLMAVTPWSTPIEILAVQQL